ncbi:MAG: hypothetical protein PHR35_12620 [Kiritimatiellae bacterium]|nr:hypothetical protein [Kiritimatiellia bacterium]
MSLKAARRTAWVFLGVSMVLSATMAYGQNVAPITGERLAGMNATALLGTALIFSLTVLGILVRFIASEWMRQQKETVRVMTEVCDAIEKCKGRG